MDVYGRSGYVSDLDINAGLSIVIMDELRKNLWIDRQTRALIIEYSLYNPSKQIYTSVSLMAEFPSSGGVTTSYRILSFQSAIHHTKSSTFSQSIAYIFVALSALMALSQTSLLLYQGCNYFNDNWQILDGIIAICNVVVAIMFTIRTIAVDKVMVSYHRDPTEFLNLYPPAFIDRISADVFAFSVFFMTLKLLKILRFHKRLTAILLVLEALMPELKNFAVVLFGLALAYALLGYLIFGHYVYEYSSISHCLVSLFSTVMGKNHVSTSDCQELCRRCRIYRWILFQPKKVISQYDFSTYNAYIGVISDSRLHRARLIIWMFSLDCR